MRGKKGFTLMEVIVSLVILSMTVAGMANVFISGRRYILRSRWRMAGGELGKLFISPLQMDVREDTWNQTSNSLYVPAIPANAVTTTYCDSDPAHATAQNPVCPAATERVLDLIPYTAQYDISNHPNSQNIRKVVATIRWTERAP